MPELPEVEAARRRCERQGVGRRIVAAEVPPDERLLRGTEAAAVRAAVLGRQIRGVERHGKLLWWVLDGRPWPAFHLGMSGMFWVRRPDTAIWEGQILANGVGGPGPRVPLRFVVTLDDGGAIGLTDARRFGRILLTSDLGTPGRWPGLGPDAYTALPDPPLLAQRLAARRGRIKAVLLDQSFLAGIGNWVADEVLHLAAIDPRAVAGQLDPHAVERLHEALVQVLDIAVRADAESSLYPREWLFHLRFRGAQRSVGEGPPVAVTRVAGRTTLARAAAVPERTQPER